ncbi:3423_t:CDS:2, partial [Cetraspora pellucida]
MQHSVEEFNFKIHILHNQNFYNDNDKLKYEKATKLLHSQKKSKVIELACYTSNKFAAHCYSLDLTIVGQWVKQFSQDPPLQKSFRRVGSRHHALFPKEEAQLYEWIMELRKDSFAVNHSNIKTKMVEIMRSSARLAQDEAEKLAIANFKFLQHWLGHFLKCYDLSLRHKTNIMQKLPDDLENKLLKFQQLVICLCQKNNYSL